MNQKHMKTIRDILLLALLFLGVACQQKTSSDTQLNIHFIANANDHLHFSWVTNASQPQFSQSAVRIVVGHSISELRDEKSRVWDSGTMPMVENSYECSEATLKNGERYYASIQVWDAEGNTTGWSAPQAFYTPIDYPQDWTSQWITYDYTKESPLPVFKKVISLDKPQDVDYARVYIAAPSFYEASVDGVKLGNNVLDPGQTNYDDYVYYTAYDIPVNKKQNSYALSIMLGNGWYNQTMVWGKRMTYGQPTFMAQVVVKYKDGTQAIIGTDESWLWHYGPITFSNIYAGETYDATQEIPDVASPESSSEWQNALLCEKHPNAVFEQFAQPIQAMEERSVKQIIPMTDGTCIFDFGQNFAGWVKLKVKGAKGQKITMKLVEELKADGTIDVRTTGNRATKVVQTQTYICKGNDVEVWEPKFTYFGFRYAEVTGLDAPPTKDLLSGVVLYSAMPKAGEFSCNEPVVNKLHQMADWTIKSNIHSIPTDCPHREKCGWTGDAHALAKALIYNYDAHLIFNKYLFDLRSSARRTNKELYFGEHFHDRSIIRKPKGIPTMIVPGKRTSGIASPDWGSVVVQLPWYQYLYYGDAFVLSEFYPDMTTWVDYINAKNVEGLITHGLGDWCPPGGNTNIDCPVTLSSTAFHILDLQLMCKVTKLLGKDADYTRYKAMLEESIGAFNAKFYDEASGSYGGQTANAMALEIGIVPQEHRTKVAQAIVDDMHNNHHGFISTGIFGLPRLFPSLAECGFEDEVYRLLTKTGEHSFAYMWEAYDATTLWEVLPFSHQADEELKFRSHSHPMQASYDAWFYSGIGGISPSEAEVGFKKIVFKPYLTQYMQHAEVSYQSPYGAIESRWKNEGSTFTWLISIPDNATGEVFVPTYQQQVAITVNGATLDISTCTADFISLGDFLPGTYTIVVYK